MNDVQATASATALGAALAVENLVAGYGAMPVVRDLSLTVAPGEVVAMLGPNGAGKTTTLATIAGLLKPLGGSISVLGEDVGKSSPEVRARRGMALLPARRGIFSQLTVTENLKLHTRQRLDLDAALADFPALAAIAGRKAGLLSGGEQQMLGLACKLLNDPSLLLVDEMSLGLAPLIVKGLLRSLRERADRGLAVLLVEQHVHAALEIADRVYVLSHGELVLAASGDDVRADPDMLHDSYMGDHRS